MKAYKNPELELMELLTREDILSTSIGAEEELPIVNQEENPHDTPPMSLL